jgi:hypothetical protein
MRTITLLLLALPLDACLLRDTVTSTSITIRDASQIAMEAGPEHEEILPPGTTPHEVPLDEGRIQTGADTAADYSVSAHREADGSLGLSWDTKLPLADGERQSLWRNGETLEGGGTADRVAPRGDQLHLDQCASLHRGFSRRSASFYASSTTRGVSTDPLGTPFRCLAGTGDVPYSISTPWSNVVVETHQKSTLRWKGFGWTVLPATALALGSGVYLAARPGDSVARRVGGAILMGIGLGVQIPLLPSMIAHDRAVTIPVSR